MFDEHIKAHDAAIRKEVTDQFAKAIFALDGAIHTLKNLVDDSGVVTASPAAKAPKVRTAPAPKGRAVFVTAGEAKEAAPKVLTAMVGRGNVRCKDIAISASLPVPVVSKAMRILKDEGNVEWVSGQTGAALYQLTEKGREAASWTQLSNGSDTASTEPTSEESESPQQEG